MNKKIFLGEKNNFEKVMDFIKQQHPNFSNTTIIALSVKKLRDTTEKAREMLYNEITEIANSPVNYLESMNARKELIDMAKKYRDCIDRELVYYVADLSKLVTTIIDNGFDFDSDEVQDTLINIVTERLLETIEKCRKNNRFFERLEEIRKKAIHEKTFQEFLEIKKEFTKELLQYSGIYDKFIEELINDIYSTNSLTKYELEYVIEDATACMNNAKEMLISLVNKVQEKIINGHKITLEDFPSVLTNPWCLCQEVPCSDCVWFLQECTRNKKYMEFIEEIQKKLLYKKVQEISEILEIHSRKLVNINTIDGLTKWYNVFVNKILKTVYNDNTMKIKISESKIDPLTTKSIILGLMDNIITWTKEANKNTESLNNYIIASVIHLVGYMEILFCGGEQ